MTHVAQHDVRRKIPPYWWEGIADYVPYRLGYTHGSSAPRCTAVFPHYTDGYECAAAFLLYVDANYSSNVVRQLNSELRRGKYSDAFFAKVTGVSLDELWARFCQTPAVTPEAAKILNLRDSLGYVNGNPPKDIEARTVAYVRQQPAGSRTLDAVHFLNQLAKSNRLPGWPKGAKPEWRFPLLPPELLDVEDYPIPRTLKAVRKGDSSFYYYLVVRQPRDRDWKLEKAWQTNLDGRAIREYPLP